MCLVPCLMPLMMRRPCLISPGGWRNVNQISHSGSRACRAAVPRAGRTGLDPVHAVGAPRGRRHRLPQALRALPQVARLPLAGAGKLLLLARMCAAVQAACLPLARKRHRLLPMSCTHCLLLACLHALGTMGGCLLLIWCCFQLLSQGTGHLWVAWGARAHGVSSDGLGGERTKKASHAGDMRMQGLEDSYTLRISVRRCMRRPQRWSGQASAMRPFRATSLSSGSRRTSACQAQARTTLL